MSKNGLIYIHGSGRFTKIGDEAKLKVLPASYKSSSICPALTIDVTNEEIWGRLDGENINIANATTAIELVCADKLTKLSNLSNKNAEGTDSSEISRNREEGMPLNTKVIRQTRLSTGRQ